MINLEYDCLDERLRVLHMTDTFETEEDLQKELKSCRDEMSVLWDSVRVTDDNGKRRVAKIILMEA